MDLDEAKDLKALGVMWNPSRDTFKFMVDLNNYSTPKTKRQVVSQAARIFDPIGFLAPVIIKVKLLLQSIWENGIGWDDPIPKKILQNWICIKDELPELQRIEIPRWIDFEANADCKCELHGFSDASLGAYSAVIYMRIIRDESIEVHLLTAKTKVAPLKSSVSLPKLELCGATLLANLINQTIKTLQIENVQYFAWADSTVALSWINNHPRKWKTFVANRVAEIQTLTDPEKWFYVKSRENPADVASRGILSSKLKTHNLWWNGPTWLKSESIVYSVPPNLSTKLEQKKVNTVHVALDSEPTLLQKLLGNFSSLSKTQRVTAYVLRFVNNAWSDQDRNKGPLTVLELKQALETLVKATQYEYFKEEINILRNKNQLKKTNRLVSLSPFLDGNNILRVGGRLENADWSDNREHPIILPHKSNLTTLVLEQAHKTTLHGGNNLMQEAIRQQFWILNGLKAIKGYNHQCVKCHRLKAQTTQQMMGMLPKARVVASPPFSHCGVDYAGPFDILLSRTRGSKTKKGYIAIFICLTTKAIHIEVVTELTSSAFIAAFRRLVARRGPVAHMYSDNGTNFVGASKIIAKLQNEDYYQKDVQEVLSQVGTQWHFIPPASPHFGGLWEAGVKSIKYHMRRVIGDKNLTYEELTTLMTQIEGCLNSRPLCPLTEDPESLDVLTPAHFLTGTPILTVPEATRYPEKVTLKDKWEDIQKMKQEFWRKWSTEYLGRLQQRPKWTKQEINIKPQDLVLIKEDRLPPTQWALGRVISTSPGTDGLTRVVTVKTQFGTLTRPVTKISLLPVNNSNSSEEIGDLKEVSDSNKSTNQKRKDSTLIPDNPNAKRRKHGNSQTIPRSDPSKIAYLCLFVLLFVAVLGEKTDSNTKYNIEQLQNNEGMYFDKVANVQLYSSSWNLLIYYDLRAYWKELFGITSTTRKIEELCDNQRAIVGLHKQLCKSTVSQLKQHIKDLEQLNDILNQQNDNIVNRRKRAPFEIFGTIANKLFGVLDQDFANKYENDIENIKNNEEVLRILMKNQTIIAENTLNVIKKDHQLVDQRINEMYLHIREIESQKNRTDQAIFVTTTFNMVTLLLTLSMIHFQPVQQNILSVITNTKHGKLDSHIVTPIQLREHLKTIREQLPSNLKLPGDGERGNLLSIYSLLHTRVRFTGKRVLFEIKIPLLNSEKFGLYKVIPLPILYQDKHVYIEPTTPYLAINDQKDHYSPLTETAIQKCEQVSHHQHQLLICSLTQPIFTSRATQSRFLKGNSSSSACNTPRKWSSAVAAGGCQNNGQLEAMPSSALAVLPSTSSSACSLSSMAIAATATAGAVSSPVPLLGTPHNVTSTTTNLLTPGNDRFRNSRHNDSFIGNCSLDDSLQLRSSTPTSSFRKDTSNLRKSLSKAFDAVHESDNEFYSSLFDGSPGRTPDSRLFKSDTSTPFRRMSKSGAEGHNESISSFGSANKSKSFDKSIAKKSPAAGLCLGDFMVTPSRQKRRTNKEHLGSENRSSSEPGGKGTPSQKPKRRVVPTLVSKATNSFTSPAFRSENNILEIAKDEVPVSSQSGMLEEREALKTQMNAIAKEFTTEALPLPQTLQMIIQEKMTPKRKVHKAKINLAEVTGKHLLERLILIHSSVIDINLASNILTELSFLINLLNIETDLNEDCVPIVSQNSFDSDSNPIDPKLINETSGAIDSDIYSTLKTINNCVYYALGVLQRQKPNLLLLDVTTLKVILDNERIQSYDKDLRNQLESVCAYKIRLQAIKSNHEVAFPIRQDFRNVFYQQDNDTKNNFPTEREFTAFKQQRDMFYGILKTWECKHLDPTWKFSLMLGSKVHALLMLQDNPINMAHLAKLFISQLIISSNFPHSPTELEISLPNVDLNKLTKLRQRLVTPSHFSTDYQFPGNQAFFRDFLLACSKSLLFIEQLKIALAAQLIEMNNSSYEILNLSSKDMHGREYNEYLVRPETLATMRILSKFLGLVETLPYTYEGIHNSQVDDRQIELRNMVQPSFDIMAILRKSITERKLIITIPWTVQYLSMLDYVTLRLTYYRRVFQLLYEIYMNLTANVQNSIEIFHMRPTSIFIIRTSLGWLFDNPNLPEDYYKYRQNRRFLFDFVSFDVIEMTNNGDTLSVSKRLPDIHSMAAASHPNALQQRQQPHLATIRPMQNSNEVCYAESLFDPLLENVLNVACPFLADFRVSIMPAKFSKSVSRSGRYRHITTKISEISSMGHENGRTDDTQTKLSEAFLHSQSLSMRKIVEFVIERTTSAVIKDFQIEILIPSKTKAMTEVGEIDSVELKHVSNEIYKIFSNTHKKAMHVWDEIIPKMIEARVKQALDALLPRETLEAIKRTCTALVIQKCKTKTEDWRSSNLHNLEFYCKDITTEAEKVIKNNEACKQDVSTVLKIKLNAPIPSKMFDRLQHILHNSTTNPSALDTEEIVAFSETFRNCLSSQTLPTAMTRLSGVMMVNLVQNLIQYNCDIVSDNLIDSFIKLWTCEKLKEFVRTPTLIKDENESSNSDYIFSGLLTKFYIQMLGNNDKVYSSLSRLLIALVNHNLMTIDYMNNQFVNLLKNEWPQGISKTISSMLDDIAQRTTINHTNSDDKSQLFMEMLADLTRDLDEF